MSTRVERIWSKLMERVVLVENPELGTDCWLWTGGHSGTGRGGGYGRMCLDGGTVAVHRVAFQLVNGPLPPKKQVDHLCRNRMCFRPEHLEMVTHKENQRRRTKS